MSASPRYPQIGFSTDATCTKPLVAPVSLNPQTRMATVAFTFPATAVPRNKDSQTYYVCAAKGTGPWLPSLCNTITVYGMSRVAGCLCIHPPATHCHAMPHAVQGISGVNAPCFNIVKDLTFGPTAVKGLFTSWPGCGDQPTVGFSTTATCTNIIRSMPLTINRYV